LHVAIQQQLGLHPAKLWQFLSACTASSDFKIEPQFFSCESKVFAFSDGSSKD